MVRIKCSANYIYPENTGTHITLSPVYSGSDENKRFWAATPGGMVQFFTVNNEAAAMFKLGQEYYVDIHPAEPKEVPVKEKPIEAYGDFPEGTPAHVAFLKARIREAEGREASLRAENGVLHTHIERVEGLLKRLREVMGNE